PREPRSPAVLDAARPTQPELRGLQRWAGQIILSCGWGSEDPLLRRKNTMLKQQVVAILNEIGTLLEIQGENMFKVRAYYNAARTIEQLDKELSDVVASGELGELRGIGDTLKEKITTLVTTGKLPWYENLKKKTPAGLFSMLRVAGLGPKKV